jgi:restriction system protein
MYSDILPFQLRGYGMWEVRVKHDELKAYRVVRGVTREEAELKASLQVANWNERWARRVAAEKARLERRRVSYDLATNRATARHRTEALEGEIAALQTILHTGLRAAPLEWGHLKDESNYSVPRPKEPTALPLPVKPAYPAPPDPASFAIPLKFIDKLIPSRRAKKHSDADTGYAAAEAAWKTACQQIDASHEKQLADHEAKRKRGEESHRKALDAWGKGLQEHAERRRLQHEQIAALRKEYESGMAPAVEYFFTEVLNGSVYPESFPQGSTVAFIEKSGVLIVDFELPNQTALPSIKEVKYVATRQEFQEVPVSDAWLKKTYDEVLYQIALRTLYELYSTDLACVLNSVVFNGWVQSIDRATGVETHGCILTVQANREEFLQVNLEQVEPRACFRRLKGIASAKLVDLTPVRPILSINKDDSRFVEGYAVAESLDDRTNLAAMDWLDFENLIRELFEKEFSKNGGEVKITQASRDGGVDAIAFDPDPIRGGKIVIQAKRYTNVVGVSAVRDLYGTVHNEGANKGILVTTSTYGSDAYEFAKDKPLTLLSGAELLGLLAVHGHRAKIDLREAKALNLTR